MAPGPNGRNAELPSVGVMLQCGEVGLARYERADAEQRYDGERRNRHDFGEAE